MLYTAHWFLKISAIAPSRSKILLILTTSALLILNESSPKLYVDRTSELCKVTTTALVPSDSYPQGLLVHYCPETSCLVSLQDSTRLRE